MAKPRSASLASPPQQDLRRWSPAAVAIVALAACVAGLLNDFAQDDLALIADNARVHGLGAWRVLLSSSYWPPPYAARLFRPLSSLAFAAEYAAGFGSTLVFRIASYLLYAGVCVAFLRLARRLLDPRVALAAGLLFAAHPVHVEAVALAVNQSELIVALLALVSVTRYVDARRRGLPSPRDWLLLAGCYAAACLVKETGFILPGLIVAAELGLGFERGPGDARRIAIGVGVLATLGAMLLALRSFVLGGALAGDFTAEALIGLSMGGRALTMLQIVPRWLVLLAWPAHLQVDYSPKEIVASTHLGAVELVGAAILVAAVIAAFALRRRAPVVSFGLVWCGVALFPVSNVVVASGIVLAERTLFLPSVGFTLAVCAAAQRALARRGARPRERRVLAVLAGALIVAGVARSAVRERDWRNNWILWYHTAQAAPRSYRAQRAFGEVLLQIGQRAQAIDAFDRAIDASPYPWLIQNELATRLRDAGDDLLALRYLTASLAEKRDQPEARAELVADLLALGRYADASREAAAAVASGQAPAVFRGLITVADSALRAGAPVGSVRLRINTAPVSAAPP